tara:strand:+ start:21301 stop:21735 length:435 start_codon:yes stop_codon:yes gene_type:complete
MLNKSKVGLKKVVTTLNSVVKSLTGSKVVNKIIGKSSQKVLNNLGKFVVRIPLAGGIFAYVFVQAGKGIVILTTTVDKLVDSSGKIVSSALLGAGDLSVWALDTITGATKKVVSKVNLGKTKKRRRRKGRKSRKKRKSKSRRRK